MVPTEGLEPPHLAAHGPEPCASTNSATWALKILRQLDCFTQTKTPQSETITAHRCTASEINSGRVVPTEGLEPPHLAAHGPEPCASTNSATWALKILRQLDCFTQTKTPQSETITAHRCTASEINSGRVVPTEGLEPPHLAAHGPEPCASTNSATWALLLLAVEGVSADICYHTSL